MTGPLLIAIDAGGTAVKAVAFDLDGQEIAHRTADVQTEHHQDGRVERDADAFWDGAARALRGIVKSCAGRDILAVACTGYGNGLFAVDADGHGTQPGIVSVDHRAQPIVDTLAASNELDGLAQITGQRLWGGQSLLQIAWLAQRYPHVLTRSRWLLCCKDFIRFRLTGEALTDPTDASGGGMVDLSTGDYARTVFQALGAGSALDKLPAIVPSTAIAGRISPLAARETGLPEGTPVAGSMMDVAAASLAAGAVDAPVLTMIAGTWSVNSIETANPLPGATPILNMLYRTDRRLIAEGSPSSAANLGWFLEHAVGGRVSMEEANRYVAACTVQTRRCQFLPFVFGPEPRRGGFLDMGSNDDVGTMLLAIFDGVAFQHRRHADDAVLMAAKPFPDTIRLAGGAARSSTWAQVFANVCQRRVESVHASEVGALGAAICASVAAGVYHDLAEAVSRMSSVSRCHQHDPALAGYYDARFAEFLQFDHGMMQLMKHRR